MSDVRCQLIQCFHLFYWVLSASRETEEAAPRTSAFGQIYLLWRSKLSLNRKYVNLRGHVV